MPDRLAHDEAFLLARRLLALTGHLLREEERRDAFGEIYRLAKEAIERYSEAAARGRKRLRPEGDRP